MGAKVMIVDDDEENRDYVQFTLADEGIDVVKVGGGAQCLALLRDGFRGLILLDVTMPGMDGWQTVKAIVDAGLLKGNLISMLTSVEHPPADAVELTSHVLNYIKKPYDQDKFVAFVRSSIELLGDGHGNRP